jgi:hypothetical protein
VSNGLGSKFSAGANNKVLSEVILGRVYELGFGFGVAERNLFFLGLVFVSFG